MNKQQLFENIKRKKSFLCVGLDTDIKKIPEHLLKEEDPIFAFNKAIIDATADLCIFLRFVLFTFTSSAKLKISRMSLSFSNPMALSKVVTGNFFLRSMYAYMTLLMSVANSIHEPLNGMIRAEYNLVPLACTLCPKNTPGER